MKKFLSGMLAATAMTATSWAVPTLQLDVSDGVYGADETIYSTGPQFSLYALISGGIDANARYYIAAAIVPQSGTGTPFGSFSINGTSYDHNDLVYGIPPVEDPLFNPDNIGGHDIYETLFLELAFTPSNANRATEYNSQDNPGGLVINPVGSLIYHEFTVDVSGLDPGYAVHFDLYNIDTITRGGGPNRTTGTIIGDFAPFSHDAQSGGRRVPDAGTTLMLLGAGMIGVGALRRRLSK